MRRLLVPVLAAAAALGASPVRAADDDPLQGLTAAHVLEIATELSADAMKGRKTGFDGGTRVEEWMQSAFGRLGLDPMDRDGIYLQTFTFDAADAGTGFAVAIDGAALAYRTDFAELAYGGTGDVTAEVVFVGYGISAGDRGWDDYDGLDVKGKVVLAIRGAPASREGEFDVERMIGPKAALAAARGAAGFLIAEGATPVSGGTIQARWHQPALPAAWISAAAADRILSKRGRTFLDLVRTRDAGDPGRSFATGTQVTLKAEGRFLRGARGRNALAGFHGRDPAVRDEVVLVGAHMDHLGVDPTGQVYNGADDNASGAAVLVALAETLKKNRWRPRRSVVFCAFAGEEQGLVGSRHLVSDLPFPGHLVAMLNLDAVGEGTPENGVPALDLGGGERYPALFARVRAAWPKGVPAHPFAVGETSDHWPFFDRGVPALFVRGRGSHPHYHRVDDDAKDLDPAFLEAAGTAVGRAIVALGDAEEPIGSDRALAEYLLRAPGRVVDAPETAALVAALLSGPPGDAAKADALRDAGIGAAVVPVDEGAEGAAVAWARFEAAVHAHAGQAALVRAGSDLVNVPRSGRVALLPRLRCARSAKAFPGVLSTYRRMGALLVAPFDAALATTREEREAILSAAATAGCLVDLTGLAPAAIVELGLDRRPVPTLLVVPAGGSPSVATLRSQMGPRGVVAVTGADAAAFLTPESLGDEDDGSLAATWVASGDSAALSSAISAAEGPANLAESDAPARARLLRRLGGAFVAALRRLPTP